MPRPLPIALVFSFSLSYCRGVLRGISRYAADRPEWTLTPLAPGPDLAASLAAVKPRGIIAHIYDRKLARLLGGRHVRLSEAMLARLVAHDWPGNVRELSNMLARAIILAGDGPIEDAHVQLPAARVVPADLSGQLQRREAEVLGRALAESGGRRGEAARRLGISERTLRYKLAAQAGRPRGAARAAGGLLQ